MASKTLRQWILAVIVLGGALLIGFLLYSFFLKPLQTFLATSSPAKTYTVFLKGQKTKPIFFTAEIRFDVSKSGTPMLLDKFLYSADGMDFPFETWYPNHRWINEQTIQFYREWNLKETAPQNVVVVNNTGKTIKYAKIDSIDIIVFFELQPGFKASIPTSQSKGDLKWLSVEGQFSDGTSISAFGADFPVEDQGKPKTLYVDLRADKTTVEMISAKADSACENIADIKILPHKDEPVDDRAYNALFAEGEKAIPCLIRKITDSTPMPDPRQAPRVRGTQVGDVAYFILIRIAKIQFEDYLTKAVLSSYRKNGVYGYFEQIDESNNRAQLQQNLRKWYEQKAGITLPR